MFAPVRSYLKYNYGASLTETIQVTLLFQGYVPDFLEDGVFTR